MKHILKAWLVDNMLTLDSEKDKILALESAGNASLEDILKAMKEEDTGLRPETLEHVVKLYHRTVADFLYKGYSVNTGLYRAVPRFRGIVNNGRWNPEKNSVYISFTQDKELREGTADIAVNILGERNDWCYIAGVEDTSTHATDGSATAGRNLMVMGRLIKIAGNHASVGITLTAPDGKVTPLPKELLAINHPKKLVLLLPAHLKEGEYTLTVTTQSSTGSALLKQPRSASYTIRVREAAPLQESAL